MAEPIKIEVFRQKNAGDFTTALSDADSRLDSGSGAAAAAALSAAFLHRAAELTLRTLPEQERVSYIFRNAEILRSYMVHLIDEDVKSRGPLRRAAKEGAEREIEAARQPAVAIPSEIVNMMGKELELAKELCVFCPKDALHYLGECAELALASVKCARLYILDMSDRCSDDTYRFVARRENELLLQACSENAAAVLAAAEKAV
ncbi:MAG: cyclodeaminase/cyclohydrolase family protein [Oscillospiraceae bacterium]|nr:cyclodeaminase/cyclohydrolase family protein [Oscillospiraceae bacterium]